MAAFLPEVYDNNTRRRVRRPCCRGGWFPGGSELSQNVRIGAALRHVGGTQAARNFGILVETSVRLTS
jgi:hypothetical protein